jgi:hypothetical protein
MNEGVLTLNRFNGQEQFAISEANINTLEKSNYVDLNFDIETAELPIKTLQDTQLLRAKPNAEFTVRLPKISLDKLVGKAFKIPKGYDEKRNEFYTRFYYSDHETTNNNFIHIKERKRNAFRVIIKATCPDVNYIDGSKPETIIEIDAWFNIKNQ